MAGFYVTLAVAQVVKMRVLRTGPITIGQVHAEEGKLDAVEFPFTLTYNLDLAYGTKIERLNREVKEIIRNEKHWFNEPMSLPPYLEVSYRQLQTEMNAKLALVGRPPERDWASFDTPMTDEEVLDLSYPVTKFLQQNQGFNWPHSNQQLCDPICDEPAV
eukprot:scaffold63_cov306-Pinguiococcus_pyrenoidosus.AAC.57